MARTEWLSEGAERLAFELGAAPGPHCDVAIVGSGYGGAVAAARLAGATEPGGRRSRVWLLERGREYVRGSFPERFADLPGHVRWQAGANPEPRGLREGLFDLRLGEHVSALLGNGLGGGSLINAGVLARPLASVFHQRPWPWQFADDALEPYFARVEDVLAQRRTPQPAPAKLETLERLARRIDGADADRRANIAVRFDGGAARNRFGVPQRECIRCGDCFTGCNHGAKNTLAVNYLPLAYRRGARLFTGVTVISVHRAGSLWALQLRFTDEQIRRRYGEEIRTLFARRVILAAGAYGSTGILLRSRVHGFDELSTRQLGRRFSTNGDMIAVATGMRRDVHASAHEADPPGNRGIGPTICGLVDLRSRSVPIAIEELAIPAALRRPFEEIVSSLAALHGLAKIDWSTHRSDRAGLDAAAFNTGAIDRTAVYATMGDDGAAGEMRLMEDPRSIISDAGVHIEWPRVAQHPVFREAIAILERAHGPFGGTVIPNPMWSALPESLGGVLEGGALGGGVFTVHPLGGCAMAGRAEDGVVNRFGQVFSREQGSAVHETLAVLDGAIVPTALAINPCLTIAALAEHGVERLARRWRLALAPDAQMPHRLPVPRRPRRRPHAVPQPTGLRLAERLTCNELMLPVRMAGGGAALSPFRAELEIRYQQVGHLGRFLETLPKVMPIPEACLRLEGTLPPGAVLGGGVQWSETLALRGRLRFFEREDSWWLGRIARAGWAWWENRGSLELPQMLRDWWRGELRLGPGLRRAVGGWLGVASRAGEARRMIYELEVLAGRLLDVGDRLIGEKRIAYVVPDLWNRHAWPTPWDQLTKLPVRLDSPAGPGPVMGVFDVDLPYFVQHHATQLQVAAQQDQPRAIADFLSFLGYVIRVVGTIHLWSLRAPDYPRRYPLYEFLDFFNAEERLEAQAAARAADRRTEDRLAHRLPGDVGLPCTVVEASPWQAGQSYPDAVRDHPAQQELAPRIRLTRYGAGGGRPVLLVHGLGASGNTFTLPKAGENLVQFLVAANLDPWVLDLRTSIGLACSKRDWSFDETALGDIPAALQIVRQRTQAESVDVVAHCIGSAMFCMAALDGRLRDSLAHPLAARMEGIYRRAHMLPGGGVRAYRRDPDADWVRAAVLSQVGPLLELPATNRFRGFLASYFRHYLQIGEFDTAASLNGFNRFVDRILGTYPYPRYEWGQHRAPHWSMPVTHEAFCLRTYGIYGRLFEHRKLDEATLERLGDYIGHIRYRTYQQTIFYATMRRLTDQEGRNRYVRHEAVREYLAFPICFLHGARNEVFDRQTSRRSFDLLASVFWPSDLATLWQTRPERRSGYTIFARGQHLRLHEFRTYGHQDTMIGRRSHIDVYPRIEAFLQQAGGPRQFTARRHFVVRPPRLGPIVGWLRVPRGQRAPTVRLLFAANESRSLPLYAMSIVLQGGQPVAGHARFHRLEPRLRQAQPEEPGRPTQAIDVRLPDANADYAVVVVTVHLEYHEEDPAREAGPARPDDFIGEGFDRSPVLPLDVHFPSRGRDASRMRRTRVQAYVQPVLDTLTDLGVDGQPLATQPRVCEPRYAAPVSAAVLVREVTQVADRAPPPPSLRFALASCRFAATAVDRELADAGFGRLRARLGLPGAPQLLLLAGDAIYADATYGMFDPTLGVERYDQRYFEAWSAPNAREVLRRLPVYPMLDDHEVNENFEGEPARPIPDIVMGLRAFENFQLRLTRVIPAPRATPQPSLRSPYYSRYWYSARAAGFDFFVADTRSERRRAGGRGSASGTIMSDVQRNTLQSWLVTASQTDPGRPKFIVSPSVVAPWLRESAGHASYCLRSDAWDAYPQSLRLLLEFIARRGIRNVVFLSGDYHRAIFCSMQLSLHGQASVPAYSIVCPGLYSPFPFANTHLEDVDESFDGAFKRRLGDASAPNAGELVVSYNASDIGDGNGFVCIAVTPNGAAWDLTAEFDVAGRVRPRSVLLR